MGRHWHSAVHGERKPPICLPGLQATPSIGGAICDEDKAPSDPSGVIFGNDVTYEFTVQQVIAVVPWTALAVRRAARVCSLGDGDGNADAGDVGDGDLE